MNNDLFETVIRNAKNLPKCDFPADSVLKQIASDMSNEQRSEFCKVCVSKGVFEYEYGKVVTAKQKIVIA